jgi:hypothetical protein
VFLLKQNSQVVQQLKVELFDMRKSHESGPHHAKLQFTPMATIYRWIAIMVLLTSWSCAATSYNAEHFLLIGAAEHARAGPGISAAAMS